MFRIHLLHSIKKPLPPVFPDAVASSFSRRVGGDPGWVGTVDGYGPVGRVTDAIVARSTTFSFLEDYRGLERILEKGTLIATDEGVEIRTPYDDCVLIMPSLRQLRPGVTVVRMGRIDRSVLVPSASAV